MHLKNILFDLGNVLFSIDYNLTKQAFIELGFTNFDAMYSQFTADDLFEKLETGKVSNNDFYKKLIDAHPSNITELQIKNAWNKMLLHWRKQSLTFLETLSNKYNLYLLSNTNAIHLDAINNMLQNETGLPNINHLFTKAYYSNEIFLRKPHINVFQFVLNDAGILPQQTLFIDDSINNIQTAAALGFKTHLLLDHELIENLTYENY